MGVEVKDNSKLDKWEKAQGTQEVENTTELGFEVVGGLGLYPCTISRISKHKKEF